MSKGLERYDYRLPKSRIATSPATTRDASRLLILRRIDGKIEETSFSKLAGVLPERALLVFNDTKVVPARLAVRKPTGGRVRLLVLERKGGIVHALADRRLADGDRLALTASTSFTVKGRDGAVYRLQPSFPLSRLRHILTRFGTTPIPPYIKGSPLSEAALRKRYQSVFAKTEGSAAAPTASLHFTPGLLKSLRRRGYGIAHLTLHVGLGTFAPVTDGQLSAGMLHEERYAIPRRTADAIARARRERRPIIAVGTTVLRALESAAVEPGTSVPGTEMGVRAGKGVTRLFIRERYRFRLVDGLITNFHVPRSSLLMLVSAFSGRERIMRAYRRAVRDHFRFFSFGDAMLII